MIGYLFGSDDDDDYVDDDDYDDDDDDDDTTVKCPFVQSTVIPGSRTPVAYNITRQLIYYEYKPAYRISISSPSHLHLIYYYHSKLPYPTTVSSTPC